VNGRLVQGGNVPNSDQIKRLVDEAASRR